MSVHELWQGTSRPSRRRLEPSSQSNATAVGPGHRYFPAEDQTPGCARSNTAGLCACTTETQATTRLIAINPCMAWLYVCNLTLAVSGRGERMRASGPLHCEVRFQWSR